jgi:hypothetical protein
VNRFAMIRRRLSLPSSGTPFLSCFHLVTAFLKKYILKAFRHLGKKRTGTSCGAASSASRSFPQSVGVAPKKRNPAETCPADMAILPEIVKA